MTDQVDTKVKESKSIVDPERRKDMKGASDWTGRFMEDAALTKGVGAKPAVEAVEEVKDADGKVTTAAVAAKPATNGKSVWDLDAMLLLAERNSIDTAQATFVGIREANAVGRARMTLHNMLKSRAKKRHGLFDIDGNWVDLPAEELEIMGNPERVEERDGTKIAKVKAPAATEKPAAEDQTADESADEGDEGDAE